MVDPAKYWQAAKIKIFIHATSNLCLQQIFQHVFAVFFGLTLNVKKCEII